MIGIWYGPADAIVTPPYLLIKIQIGLSFWSWLTYAIV